jgi:hypothetical protein
MRISRCLLIMALLFPAAALAQSIPPPGTTVAFKACPIYSLEGGCWLAIYKGVAYDLAGATTIPANGLTIVVRGTVTNKASFCPALALDPIEIALTVQKCTPPKWP